MKQIEEILEISYLFERWLDKIRIATAISFYDINQVSEDLAAEVLNIIFDYKLKNLNYDVKNHQGIDLGDEEIGKIGVSVTSRNDAEKIKADLKSFVENKHFEVYTSGIRFFILNLGKNYRAQFCEIYNDFDVKKHIIIVYDLMKDVRKLFNTNKKKFSELKNILKSNLNSKELVSKDVLSVNVNKLLASDNVKLKEEKAILKTKLSELSLLLETVIDSVKSDENLLLIQNNTITDLKQSAEIVRTSGISLVNNGEFSLLNKIFGKLTFAQLNDPEISLIISYAKYHNGEYSGSQYYLQNVTHKEQLSTGKKFLADTIDVYLRFRFNEIDEEMFGEELFSLEKMQEGTIIGLQLKLERLRTEFFKFKYERFESIVIEINNTIKQLIELSDTNQDIVSDIEILTWEIEGYLQNNVLYEIYLIKVMSKEFLFPKNIPELIAKIEESRKDNQQWYADYDEYKKRYELNPFLLSNIILKFSLIRLQAFVFKDSIQFEFTSSKQEEYKSVLNRIIDDLDYAEKTFAKLGAIKLNLKTKILKSEMLGYLEKYEEAKKHLIVALKLAKKYKVTEFIPIIENMIDLGGVFVNANSEKLHLNVGEVLYNTPESEREEIIKDSIEADLVDEKIIRNHVDFIIYLYEESLNHCQYIYLEHILDQATITSGFNKPPYSVKCMKFEQYCSFIGYPEDIKEFVNNFKSRYCESCSERKPKN